MKRIVTLVLALGALAGMGYQARAQSSTNSFDTSATIGVPGDPVRIGTVTNWNPTTPGPVWNVVGGGSDIWDAAPIIGDRCHYWYSILTGPFDVSLQVTNLTGPNSWTKSELMIRQPDINAPTWPNPDPRDPFLAMMTTRSAGQNEINIQYRAARNANANWPGTPSSPIRPVYPNVWQRVTRFGSIISAYYGTDGTNWTLHTTIDLANTSGWTWDLTQDTVLVGVAVTSHDNGATAAYGVATVSNIKIAPPGTILYSSVGDMYGFALRMAMIGNTFASVNKVTLDGTNDITSSITTSNDPSAITLTWPGIPPVRQVTNTTHTVDVVATLADSRTVTNKGMTYVVPYYYTVRTNFLLSLSAIDTNQPGFTVRSYQSAHRYEPNEIRWAEEQIIGLRGTNVADQTGTVNGEFAFNGLVNFWNNNGSQGAFGGDTNFTSFGIGTGNLGAPTLADNCALELCTYMYFPTSGVYQIYVESDDYFNIMTAANPRDRVGVPAMGLAAWQLPTDPSAGYHIAWAVDQPGVYPMRMVFENGNGGAGLEWFAGYPQADGTTNFILFNDTGALNPLGQPSPIRCYRATASSIQAPYIKKANPVRDGRNVLFYQPIVVDLTDGTGSMTVKSGSINLLVDNVAQTNLTLTKSGDTTHIVTQMGTNTWNTGAHTILLTYQDNAANNYTSTWPFTVISAVSRTSPIVAVPAANMVPANTLDTTQPGFRVRSYQTVAYMANANNWNEEQLEGLRGPNMTDQLYTNGWGYFSWNNVLDFASNAGATMEWNYNNPYTWFGIYGLDLNTPSFTFPFWDNCSLDIGAWLVFPTAGTYVMHVNSDDGFRVTCPYGYPFNKLGTVVGSRDAGSLTGGSSGSQVGGTYFAFSIPTAGAYPFRMIWENATGGLALEWSIYQFLPDGGMAKLPLNDPEDPTSIKAYQTRTAGDALAPYIAFVNPVLGGSNVVWYQPIVADIADGGGKTVDPTKVNLWVDGVPQTLTATKTGDTTHVVSQMGSQVWTLGVHTNLLTYTDSSATTYSNIWHFGVGYNVLANEIIDIPLTNMVPISSIDHTKPGFLIRSYQTTTANPGNSTWTEQQFLGQYGANLADQTGATGPNGSFAWTDMMDIAGNTTTYAEFGYNSFLYGYQYYGANQANGGTVVTNWGITTSSNQFSLDIGTWIEFSKAGVYLMHVNVDDGFRLTAPYGNPFNKVGRILTFRDGTGGQSGASGGLVGGFYTPIRIPAPGAYPFRLLYFNVTGGFGIEWSAYCWRPDGSLEKILINDVTNRPNAIAAYQVSSLSTPFVTAVTPVPTSGLDKTPVMNLGSAPSVTTDLTLDLADASTTVDANSIALTFNGITQPLIISQPSSGITRVVRSASDPQLWPSGGYGPLTLTYRDSAGRTAAVTWYITTAFWGTLSGPTPASSVDTTKPGFKARIYQVDGKNTTGTTVIPTRVHVAEQVLAGYYGPNVANTTNLNEGPYWFLAGTGPSNGTINYNIPGQGQAGSFIATSVPPRPDMLWPGIGFTNMISPTVNGNAGNNYAVELLAYVEFPTNGTYILGVNSDDGFRLTKGWTPPANIGALVVNSPAALAGPKPTVLNGGQTAGRGYYLASYALTNPVSGYLVLAQGIGYGSTTNGEACVITNPSELVGKIALIYRSGANFCGYLQQVQNAANAGAIGVVLVQNRPATEGPLPQEPEVNPAMPIPAVEIEQADGYALLMAGAITNNTIVNVTLNPMDYTVNPPAALSPLGQADIGKGASDVLFPVVVTQPGFYPLRLVQFQGGGGGNAEFFSMFGSSKVLVNDLTLGGLRAFYAGSGVTLPTLKLAYSPGPPPSITLTFTGGLWSSTDLKTWSLVGATSPYTIPANQAKLFFQARQ